MNLEDWKSLLDNDAEKQEIRCLFEMDPEHCYPWHQRPDFAFYIFLTNCWWHLVQEANKRPV